MRRVTSHKNPIPIHLEPFSHEHLTCMGQNPVVIDAVRRVFQITDKRGVLVINRVGQPSYQAVSGAAFGLHEP